MTNVKNLVVLTLVSTMALVATNAAVGQVSAKVGLVSDYYFRGINLGDAGAYAGLDFNFKGFYAGTWWIDDGTGSNDGLETDFFLGYKLGIKKLFSLGLVYNRYEYTYTSDFEHELALSTDFGPVGLEYAYGRDDDGAETSDYDFLAISWSGEIFGARAGTFENKDTEDSYDYVELSAAWEVSGLDMLLLIGKTTNVEFCGVEAGAGGNAYSRRRNGDHGDDGDDGDDGVGAAEVEFCDAQTGSGDGYMVLDVSKSFDLRFGLGRLGKMTRKLFVN